MKFFTAVNAYGIGLHQMRMMVPPPYPATVRAKSLSLTGLPKFNRMSTLQAYLPPFLARHIVSDAIRFNRTKRYAQLAGNPAIAHPRDSKLCDIFLYIVSHANSLLPCFTTIYHSEPAFSQRCKQ
jgi:hypothetical protein